jgi:hypothetical protein
MSQQRSRRRAVDDAHLHLHASDHSIATLRRKTDGATAPSHFNDAPIQSNECEHSASGTDYIALRRTMQLHKRSALLRTRRRHSSIETHCTPGYFLNLHRTFSSCVLPCVRTMSVHFDRYLEWVTWRLSKIKWMLNYLWKIKHQPDENRPRNPRFKDAAAVMRLNGRD